MDTLEELATRCRQAGLEAKVDEGEVEEEGAYYRFLNVQIPSGRKRRQVLVEDGDLDDVAQSRFEEFRFVDGFDAIWSPRFDSVESSLRGASWPWKNVLGVYGARLHTREVSGGSLELGAPPVVLPSPWPDVSLTIGPASPEHMVLCGETILGSRMPTRVGMGAYATLSVQGGSAKTHDEALALLQGLASTALFGLERQFGIPLHLAPSPPDIRFSLSSAPRPSAPSDVRFEPEPLELFWYGKTAGSLDLLGFLAFYQVLEYFFPAFSRRHMTLQAREILDRPGFRSQDDDAIGHLIEAITHTKNEREQLRRTLLHGVTPSVLRNFFKGESHRAHWFASREALRLSRTRLDPSVGDNQLCDQASERIYAIRCRIVHTKGGRTTDPPLFPFSTEASQLHEDRELVEFCAEQVLERTAKPLVR